ncbi:MAG: alpha/beta fold hydrolase [Salinarimonas sp.]|nr:alpha/beta fold hydrolase [Salinarimonas sp.]
MFIPGLICDADLFADQIAMLRASRHVVVADTTRDDTINAMARRLLEENPEGELILIGLSMGGYIALEAQAMAPDRITRIALFDTNARADTPEAIENRQHLIALTEAGRFDEVCETLWDKFVAEERRQDAPLRSRIAAMAANIGPDAFIRQERAIMGRRDHRSRLADILIPALVIVGDEDVLTPPALSQEMAESMPQATLGIIPDCGHLSTMERPEAVNRALSAWLES